MPSPIRLNRAELEQIVGKIPKFIRAFEEMQTVTADVVPDQVNVLTILAGIAQTLATDAAESASEALRAADEALQTRALLDDQAQRLRDIESSVSVLEATRSEGSMAASTPSSGVAIPELSADPVAPADGDTWVLRTLTNAAGTIQGLVGGIPVYTATDDFMYQLSFKTIAEGTKRVELT